MPNKCSDEGCNEEIFENGKCIFHCKKDTWYTETKDEEGKITKDWSKEMQSNGKVTKFWEKIREKTKKENANNHFVKHDFSNFIFPEFEKYKLHKGGSENHDHEFIIYKTIEDSNFWHANLEIIFNKTATFSNAKFLGKTDFKNTVFFQDAIFNAVEFLGKVDFFSVNILGVAFFEGAEFLEEANFIAVKISGGALFLNTKFFKRALFSIVDFLRVVTFYDAKFLSKTSFYGAKFTRAIFTN